MTLILVLRGYHPSTNPHQVGEFQWSERHKAYIWQGRELKLKEFNEIVDGVMDASAGLWAHPITVRAVSNDNLTKARAVLAARNPKPTPSHVPSTHPDPANGSVAVVHPSSGGSSNESRATDQLLCRPLPGGNAHLRSSNQPAITH